ncbi:MAG: segregation/condensation protein A [archaeon]
MEKDIDDSFEIPNVEIKSEADLYNLIFKEDDITWQAVILELARTEKINPWDIDVSVLAKEYLETIKKLKEMNFRLSGKVILAGAILLKLKAERLGVNQLLSLLDPDKYQQEIDEGDDTFDLEREKHFTKAGLNLTIPRARKRKVTVFELVEALKKALDVDIKRAERLAAWKNQPIRPLPEIHRVDIFAKIEAVFAKIRQFVKKFNKKTMLFEELIPSKNKKDVIWTLIPLLHLANQDKISLRQDKPFSQLYVDVHETSLKEKLEKRLFIKEEKEEGKKEVSEKKIKIKKKK